MSESWVYQRHMRRTCEKGSHTWEKLSRMRKIEKIKISNFQKNSQVWSKNSPCSANHSPLVGIWKQYLDGVHLAFSHVRRVSRVTCGTCLTWMTCLTCVMCHMDTCHVGHVRKADKIFLLKICQKISLKSGTWRIFPYFEAALGGIQSSKVTSLSQEVQCLTA